MSETELKIAKWWKPQENGKILCTLCPRYCTIGEGQKGFCFIRENINGKLYSTGYGRPSGVAVDPVEKKPLNHFYPGTEILSLGTAGCNLGCKFCQNWTLSKSKLDEVKALHLTPGDVVDLAEKHGAESIAFTYNDPTIFGEYVIDISAIAKERGINTVMVTAGYIDKDARKEIYKHIDAANVDLKAFTEKFYHELTYSHLDDVLDTLRWLKHETDVWIELTTLLIPGENDGVDEIKKMCGWVLENLGNEVPHHFTAFYPDFKLNNKSAPPPQTVINARDIALSEGIKYCYTGNIINPEGSTTYCPNCGEELIKRNWHKLEFNVMKNSCCPCCGAKIAGKF